MRHHRVSPGLLDAFVAGGDAPLVSRGLAAARYSRHATLLRAVLDRAHDVDHPDVAALDRAYQVLCAVDDAAPAAIRAVLGDPLFGAWVLRTLRSLHSTRPFTARPGELALHALSCAVRGRWDTSLDLDRAAGPLHLPTLGVVSGLDGGRGPTELRHGPAGSELRRGIRRVLIPPDPHLRSPGWWRSPVVTVARGGLSWSPRLDHRPDAGPHADLFDEPTVRRWTSMLREGWSILAERHPEIAADVAGTVSVLLPLTGPPGSSSTAPDALGAVAVADPASPSDLALSLAHEIQHVKLTTLNALAPLVADSGGAVHYAPWRDDPRPIAGLLHGAHAYLGVTRFWARERHHHSGTDRLRGHVEFARWRTATQHAADALTASRHLTPTGHAVVERMAAELAPWADEPVPAEAVALAMGAARRHRTVWETRHRLPAPHHYR